MSQSLEILLQQLHFYPDHFQDCHLRKYLSTQQIEALQNARILVPSSDLQQIICPSCDNGHFIDVYFENDEYRCRCPEDILPNVLTKTDIATWSFEVESFLLPIAETLKLHGSVDKLLIPGLWSLGSYIREGIRHYCYYYQGKNFPAAEKWIKEQHNQYRYIVLTNKQEICQSPSIESKFLTIPITEIVSLKHARVHIDQKSFFQQCVNGFRAVIFNPKNGELLVNGTSIAIVTPTTSEYYFVQALWELFNEPVAHETLARHIRNETNTQYSETDSKLCHKQKNAIKKASSDSDLINQVFFSNKDENGNLGYMMRNPV